MKRPFDLGLMGIMDQTAKFLCQEIQGAQFAYTQSDEISILLTDFEKTTTDAWFDGNIQKIVSVAASIATAKFNLEFLQIKADETYPQNSEGYLNHEILDDLKLAFFDARVWTIPDPVEVENYFVWRQKDAVRNSIAMTAQSLYSHKELEHKSQSDQQDMIHAKGQNWNDMPDGFKRGRMVTYECGIDADEHGNWRVPDQSWQVKPAFDFLKERDSLTELVPAYGTE
jgi:tRNA(His) 5'-end guanylyltransferase